MCATRGGPLWISRSPSVPAWQAMSSLTQGSPEALDSTRARRTRFEALGTIGEVRANLVRTVRARDAERGRDLRARAGSRRVRQDRRSSATLVGRARGPGLRHLGDVPWGRHGAVVLRA